MDYAQMATINNTSNTHADENKQKIKQKNKQKKKKQANRTNKNKQTNKNKWDVLKPELNMLCAISKLSIFHKHPGALFWSITLKLLGLKKEEEEEKEIVPYLSFSDN